jgi:hypothetical protein
MLSQLPPFVTPALLRAASNYLDATPNHALRPSFRTVRARRRKGRVQVRLQRRYQSLWADSKMKGLSMWLDLVTWTWTVVLDDAYCCQGDDLALGGAADAFPIFGRTMEPTLADTFWAAGVAAATLFAGSFGKWCG